MQRSPCFECDLGDQDKRNPRCDACQDRKTYVKSLGGPSYSVPVEMTDMASKKTSMKWTDEAIKYMKANVDTMTNKQLADHFGVTLSAMSNQLSVRGIKRNGDFRRGVVFKEITPKEATASGASKRYFVVDFSKHGDLFDRFLLFAKENFRTGENEILYLINQALKVTGE